MATQTRFKLAGAILAGVLAIAALGIFGWSFQLDAVPRFVAIITAIIVGLASFCVLRREDDLVHDFFFPILLFAALGGFTWAVRGSSGFGAVKGCVFAGVMWGAAWWFIARNPGAHQTRRYTSGWIVLALTLGIGLSGARGWMQWSSFFEGKLQTNTGAGEFVEISPVYGLIWLFIAGVPWAGIGACALAWCASERPLAAWKWAVRLFCGFGMAYFMNHLYQQYPQWFLPLYSNLEDRYKDLEANPNLRRLMNDNGNAIRHLGFYLGFLLFELGRRDWRNVLLISTVGVLNGLGWALCQNWKWAYAVFPDGYFNWWRCWESCGGISIGIALGVAYYFVNRPMGTDGPHPPVTGSAKKRPYFAIASILFMVSILVWFLVGSASDMASADWKDHLDAFAFVAVLIYAIGFYGRHLWVNRNAADTPEAIAEARWHPDLKTWLPQYGLLLLIAWFMMGRVHFGGQGPWWARFDYMYLAIALGYGLLYVLFYAFGAMAGRGSGRTRVSVFDRYPNLDWLATYLAFVVILATYLRDELPAWSGWFWTVQEEPTFWYALLGPAVLAFFGVAYVASRFLSRHDVPELDEAEPIRQEPNLERFGVYLGLLIGLGMSLKNGARGWANIYLQESGTEQYWGDLYWRYIGPAMLVFLVLIVLLVLFRRVRQVDHRDVFPHAAVLVAFVVVFQNIIGQGITGPITHWQEMAFNIYYLLLFFISAAVLYHYHVLKTRFATEPVSARISERAASWKDSGRSALLNDDEETPADEIPADEIPANETPADETYETAVAEHVLPGEGVEHEPMPGDDPTTLHALETPVDSTEPIPAESFEATDSMFETPEATDETVPIADLADLEADEVPPADEPSSTPWEEPRDASDIIPADDTSSGPSEDDSPRPNP